MPNELDEDSDDDDDVNVTYEVSTEPTPPPLDGTYTVPNPVQQGEELMDYPHADAEENLFFYQIPGLPAMNHHEYYYDDTSIPKNSDRRKVAFSSEPITVCLTYSKEEYDRFNDEADPIVATAEYELEKRLEKLIIFDVEIEKGSQPLGLSIVGIGVGADTGVEKLGMFVKTVVPGGSIHTDNRLDAVPFFSRSLNFV